MTPIMFKFDADGDFVVDDDEFDRKSDEAYESQFDNFEED